MHGIILVHDLTNRKSYSNLNKWINEIVPMLSDDNLTDSESEVPITRTSRLSAASTDFIDLEEFVGDAGLVPMVIVGTKRDEINDADLQRAHDASSIVVVS
ncbi:hypothetical protein SARC_14052 [Sphaeroforma arctica JP610]|uniref:Uncharacterized protein n=1 Tax=Sphaeroforma arctica JP610 TaxID=667725 RepID=A0A0L0FBC1_9EUKA|nr:hypothetical protein SARC_14052 [Sphaeroforma arctica JP610]KNC73388.1 hypothetical protein SARC_14052 [Sphaeroforma arctica JP610]|eukprot:XP_014147290.1 hypothetical protein SARC_14052 [Sphaeroforma arctica JP610]